MVLTYFTRDELIFQLRTMFTLEEEQRVDFNQLSMTEVTGGWLVRVGGRRFMVHKYLGVVLYEL